MKTGKLKMGMLMLGTLTMMTFAACNENVQGTVNEQGTVSQQEENLNAADHESVSSQEISEEVGQTDASDENPEELLQIAEISPEKKQVEIFFGNENGDGIISEVVEMEPVTATKVLGELTKKNIVSADSRVIGLSKQTKDGKIHLKLNMSKEFGEYVSMMGTSGEYIVVGSLVNTFLKAYDAEDVLILIEGEPFETGHQLYENYLQFYPQEN